MATGLEDLKILHTAEEIADSVWKRVVQWDEFSKEVVGKQMARATDSIGANIAESFGRCNYGEKLQFFYYSRGSLFESKYWLNRAQIRGLMQEGEVKNYTARLSELARQLNKFASSLKAQRQDNNSQRKVIRDSDEDYVIKEDVTALFTDIELDWLESESRVSNP